MSVIKTVNLVIIIEMVVFKLNNIFFQLFSVILTFTAFFLKQKMKITVSNNSLKIIK